jgi:glucosamine--fructose-6-phosphate aminotransferase (isomerizing)
MWSFSRSLPRLPRLLGAAAASSAGALFACRLDQVGQRRQTADACGIIAYVGKDKRDPAVQYLLEGLTILQNRGYDSAGIATLNAHNEIVSSKFASVGSSSDSIDILREKAPAL